MPKESYAQTVTTLQEAVAATRSLAGVLPPLALTVADKIEAQIAVTKDLKSRQRTYAAEHREVAAAKRAAMARGMVAARDIRACVVLVFGPRDARITQFGMRLRRRPTRKGGTASPDARARAQVQASPVCPNEDGSTAVLDEAWISHTTRANGAAIGGEAAAMRGNADPVRGNEENGGGNAQTVGASGAPVRAVAAAVGAEAFDDGGNASAPGGNSQAAGGNLETDPEAASLAA
jgi:hypothetical protein